MRSAKPSTLPFASTTALLTMCAISLTACSTPMSMASPDSRTVAAGAAGGASHTGNDKLEHCFAPVGTASFIEDTSARWYQMLTGTYKLPSTATLLRLLAQQSNCFIVVERNEGFQAIQGERALEQSGELRRGSHYGKGQMVAADYAITPSITFSSENKGGLGGAALFGLASGVPYIGLLGSLVGSIRRNEAATVLVLTDNRTGVQLAIAEGSASNMDIGMLGGLGWGGQQQWAPRVATRARPRENCWPRHLPIRSTRSSEPLDRTRHSRLKEASVPVRADGSG